MNDTKLPANLPENWQHGQIIAPTGAEVGLEEQYGYNYLMKQVNDAQKGINEIREELANKANVGPPTVYDLELENGFERINAAGYWKDAHSLVTIHFKVQLADGTTLAPANYQVATLPEGFRPLIHVAHSVGYAEGGPTTHSGYVPIYIGAAGALTVRIINECQSIFCSISYYAV